MADKALIDGPRHFRPSILPADAVPREVSWVSFADLVRMAAEGIADAQASLDRTSVALMKEMAEPDVDVVPTVTEEIDAEGNVSVTSGQPRKASLLSLGVTPAFYRFSEVTVEVSMDLRTVEDTTSQSVEKKRHGLLAGTSELRTERKLRSELSALSKVTAKLVAVPMPIQLEPVRTTTSPDA
ncbi:MAG TPA: hypothetical protein VKA35_03875 [Solirubrobacterales bacterium]|nr:hypothetical protein [Solirubrobacterales bacterium]